MLQYRVGKVSLLDFKLEICVSQICHLRVSCCRTRFVSISNLQTANMVLSTSALCQLGRQRWPRERCILQRLPVDNFFRELKVLDF